MANGKSSFSHLTLFPRKKVLSSMANEKWQMVNGKSFFSRPVPSAYCFLAASFTMQPCP
jgi:hypothetical protein